MCQWAPLSREASLCLQSSDFALRYHSLHDNQYLRYFRGHTARVTNVAMSPKNDLFMSAAEVCPRTTHQQNLPMKLPCLCHAEPYPRRLPRFCPGSSRLAQHDKAVIILGLIATHAA